MNKSYYAATGFGSTGTADGLETTAVQTPSQSVSQTYTYDPSRKRLETITINGVTITYAYLTNSNQVWSISVGNVTTNFGTDASDKSRPRQRSHKS